MGVTLGSVHHTHRQKILETKDKEQIVKEVKAKTHFIYKTMTQIKYDSYQK